MIAYTPRPKFPWAEAAGIIAVIALLLLSLDSCAPRLYEYKRMELPEPKHKPSR